MSKLYLTYNEKNTRREYYSYDYNGTNPVYIDLNVNEIEAYFNKILSSKIASTRQVNESTIEIVLETGEVIILDGNKLFKANDKFDYYFEELQKRIKNNIEQNNITTYKNSLPESYIPRVNRKRNNKGKRLISENSITDTILLGAKPNELMVDLSEANVYNSETSKGL